MYYALVDCNNFYASCERVFDPRLKNRPLVILSNNDGCVIARSAEAKQAGVEMGVPEFKVRKLIKNRNIAVRSSNYALYGDMSRRVMETLRELVPGLEVYSIDEAFLEIPDLPDDDVIRLGRKIRTSVFKHTGLPVSVGIAKTKTLAKMANAASKSSPECNGVLFLSGGHATKHILKQTDIQNIWGIGRRCAPKLHGFGVHTAWQLQAMHDSWIKKQLSITGLRTVWELRGTPCLEIDDCRDERKGILSSRSFGKPVTNLADLCEAVTSFGARAAEKLRAQKSVASIITVTLVSDKYRNPGLPYKFGKSVTLMNPTANTLVFSAIATKITEYLYNPEIIYKKAWVMLTGIFPEAEIQADLFAGGQYSVKEHRLMDSMDAINAKFGRRSVIPASTGMDQEWQMKQQFLSRRYTTCWDELMKVTC